MPTLPIGATAVEPWLFVWRNAGGLMRLFAPWLAGIAVVIPVADALAGPAAGAAFDNLCALYSMVAVALAAVACHRAALLGATLGLGSSLRLRQREVQYLGLVALTYVVGMGFDAAYDWTWAHDPLMRLLRAIGVLWLLDAIGLHAVGVYLRLWPWFAVTALSALLWLRLAPMFPAIAGRCTHRVHRRVVVHPRQHVAAGRRECPSPGAAGCGRVRLCRAGRHERGGARRRAGAARRDICRRRTVWRPDVRCARGRLPVGDLPQAVGAA